MQIHQLKVRLQLIHEETITNTILSTDKVFKKGLTTCLVSYLTRK